jgi:membrane-associated phospholipid phosphatase
MVQWLIEADRASFLFLNRMAAGEPLATLAAGLSDMGSYSILLVTFIFLALEGWPRFRRHLLALLIVMPFAMGVNFGVKQTVHRSRPLGYYEAAVKSGQTVIHYTERLTRKSFPSGHTTMAFLAMGYLFCAQRRHARWAVFLAVGVGWSRVAVGAHFPLDCVAGALLGSFWALLAWRIHCYWESRICNKPENPIAGPGPSSGCCSGC